MEKVYVFKVALKHRKGIWRRIAIKGSQTLADFDRIIRITFKHDMYEHISAFVTRDRPSRILGVVDPEGDSTAHEVRIDQLGLSEGNKLDYIYNFCIMVEHIITLEKIIESDEGTEYPRVISRNRPKYRYCEICERNGKKTIATWICIECSDKEGKDVLLCEDCLENEHRDHYVEEILY